MGIPTTAKDTSKRFSQERFPRALKALMDERRLSYRQLAYKTKLSAGYLNHLTKGTRPVPADPVITVIAEALRVQADFFLEFRLRQVADVLSDVPALTDKLYDILLHRQPVPDDIAEVLRPLTEATPAEDDGSQRSAAVGF
jgi:transcriptional regulator with XRE-family HTH domain